MYDEATSVVLPEVSDISFEQQYMTRLSTISSTIYYFSGRDNAEENDIPLSSASIAGRPLCNLRFADDINLLRGNGQELLQLTEMLDKTAAGYSMEVSSDKGENQGIRTHGKVL